MHLLAWSRILSATSCRSACLTGKVSSQLALGHLMRRRRTEGGGSKTIEPQRSLPVRYNYALASTKRDCWSYPAMTPNRINKDKILVTLDQRLIEIFHAF